MWLIKLFQLFIKRLKVDIILYFIVLYNFILIKTNVLRNDWRAA